MTLLGTTWSGRYLCFTVLTRWRYWVQLRCMDIYDLQYSQEDVTRYNSGRYSHAIGISYNIHDQLLCRYVLWGKRINEAPKTITQNKILGTCGKCMKVTHLPMNRVHAHVNVLPQFRPRFNLCQSHSVSWGERKGREVHLNRIKSQVTNQGTITSISLLFLTHSIHSSLQGNNIQCICISSIMSLSRHLHWLQFRGVQLTRAINQL